MLIQFSIENHRSIKDGAVISFAASRISPWSLICCTQMKKGRFYLLLLFTERTLPVKVMCCTH